MEISSSTADNYTSLYFLGLEMRHGVTWSVIFIVLYLLVFIIGLIGNSLVILVICRAPNMRSVKHIYICNLAVADLFMILFVAPIHLLQALFIPWLLGPIACQISLFLQSVSVGASVLSLVAISFERFRAIWYPLRVPLRRQSARLVITFIWIFATLVSSPYSIILSFQVNEKGQEICLETWPSPMYEAVYYLFILLPSYFLLPIISISVFFILIFLKVSRRNVPSDSDSNSITISHQYKRVNVSVLKMLLVMISSFFLCWLPVYIVYGKMRMTPLLKTLGVVGDGPSTTEDDPSDYIVTLVFPLTVWLACANSIFNPIIYNFLSEDFRKKFKNIFYPSRRAVTSEGVIFYSNSAKRARYVNNSRSNNSDHHNYAINNVIVNLETSQQSVRRNYTNGNGNISSINLSNNIHNTSSSTPY